MAKIEALVTNVKIEVRKKGKVQVTYYKRPNVVEKFTDALNRRLDNDLELYVAGKLKSYGTKKTRSKSKSKKGKK